MNKIDDSTYTYFLKPEEIQATDIRSESCDFTLDPIAINRIIRG